MTHLSTPSATTTYTYDGDGVRTSETSGEQTTEFAYDPNNPLPLLALEKGSSEGTRSYIWGNGLLSVEKGGSQYYAAHDFQGSLVGLTSAAGTTEATYSYDPFGDELSSNTA